MNFFYKISEKAFFKGEAAVIVVYLLMALCAMYFPLQNIKQVCEQNIRNEGNVKKELLRHEMLRLNFIKVRHCKLKNILYFCSPKSRFAIVSIASCQ